MNDKQIDNFLRRRFSTVGWALLGYNAILNILVWAVFGLDILGGFVQNLSAGTRSLPDWDAIYGDAWGYLWAIAVGFVILQAWKGRDYWRREPAGEGKAHDRRGLCRRPVPDRGSPPGQRTVGQPGGAW